MKRYAIVSVLLVLAAVAWLSPSSTTGQDRTDERLASLETRVADQSKEISNLKRRVRALEEAARGGKAGQAQDSAEANEEGVTLSGTGVKVTDGFVLSKGRYKVTATVETAGFDGFAVLVYPPQGNEDLLFNEIIDSAGTWTGSAVFEAPMDGTYVAEVTNTSSSWTLVFQPL